MNIWYVHEDNLRFIHIIHEVMDKKWCMKKVRKLNEVERKKFSLIVRHLFLSMLFVNHVIKAR